MSQVSYHFLPTGRTPLAARAFAGVSKHLPEIPPGFRRGHCTTESDYKKIRRLSDSPAPVRPLGERTQTAAIVTNDSR